MANEIINAVLAFVAWTFLLYVVHRLVHVLPVVKWIHWDHHIHIINNKTRWHWSNLFLFNDTWTSTLDLWITEVIPTIAFSAVTGQWWLCAFYYVWAAFVQESIEHNANFNWYPFTSGKWHLQHHYMSSTNFGLFIPIWDKLFKTEQWI